MYTVIMRVNILIKTESEVNFIGTIIIMGITYRALVFTYTIRFKTGKTLFIGCILYYILNYNLLANGRSMALVGCYK